METENTADILEFCKCHVTLESRRTDFVYLNYNFHVDVPRCPKCGQVYLPKALVEGKMADVEMLLEEK